MPPHEVFRKNNGFGNFLHGLAPLAAFPLQREISFFLAELQIPLQYSFRAFNDLASFELISEVDVLRFEARSFNLRTHEKAEGGNQTNLAPSVFMAGPILHIDYTDQA